MRNLFIALATAAGLALSSVARAEDVTLTFVSYAVAKPVYAKIIPAFKKQYKAQTGNDVTFKESYGPSGAQNRAIIGGLEADVLATNLPPYVDDLVKAGLVKEDWATRVPNGASPATSVIVAITRAGNPKNIKTWTDIAGPGVEIVAINPKTSGNARWSVLAGYAALKNGEDTKAADAYVQGLVKNTKTLVAGGREATDAFVKNGVGDILLTFENEAKFAAKSGQNLPYVAPETNISTEFPVTVIDKNVDKHNSRAAAEAFVKFLFTPEAQKMYIDAGYRPADPELNKQAAANLAPVTKLITAADIGGWPEAEKKLFADGALYDQALAAVKK